MKQDNSSPLLGEEKRATKWFLGLFYIVFFVYEIIYNQTVSLMPWFNDSQNLLTYILYFVLIGLLPVFIYKLRSNNPENIKYILFYTYISVSFITEAIYYLYTGLNYTSGNIVEMVIILFSPIFVNVKFFYTLLFGLVSKYFLIGLVLLDPLVFFPIGFIFILGLIAFIILHRFISYVNSLKSSFDQKLDGIVKGFITTLELKDPYTRGHSERVANYALMLARATNLYKEKDLKYFYYSCLLHDIGKVNIPDAILMKPGSLNDKEYDTVKTHPSIGANAVRDVEGISDFIDIIKHHHERWDGKGYPSGLAKEDIPFAARITAIADAFDAMTSNRSYRSALPVEEAYNRIFEGSGTQFDPELVELFSKVFPSWVDFKKQYELREQENPIIDP